MPYSESASTTAFITAGKDPAQPASPHPLAPSGLVFAGTGWQPFGKAEGELSWMRCTSRDCGNSGGSCNPRRNIVANSITSIKRSVPAISNRPRENSNIGGRGFEYMRGNLPALLDHLLARPDNCGAACHQRF